MRGQRLLGGGVLNATVVGQTWYADRLINSGHALSQRPTLNTWSKQMQGNAALQR